jgi:hypothetical protein
VPEGKISPRSSPYLIFEQQEISTNRQDRNVPLGPSTVTATIRRAQDRVTSKPRCFHTRLTIPKKHTRGEEIAEIHKEIYQPLNLTAFNTNEQSVHFYPWFPSSSRNDKFSFRFPTYPA